MAQFLLGRRRALEAGAGRGLLGATGLAKLYERSDTSPAPGRPARRPRAGCGGGPTELTIQEHDWQLGLDIADRPQDRLLPGPARQPQENGRTVGRMGPQRVLNCYSYTGGFTVAALAGGAGHVRPSIRRPGAGAGRRECRAQRLGAENADFLDADVNASLRKFVEKGRTFDAIVLDPPKLAPTVAHADRAARAYKDINRLAFKLLEPGGVLFTYSCSGRHRPRPVPQDRGLGRQRRRGGRIHHRTPGRCPPDHAMTLNFPEGEYLKGLIVVRK